MFILAVVLQIQEWVAINVSRMCFISLLAFEFIRPFCCRTRSPACLVLRSILSLWESSLWVLNLRGVQVGGEISVDFFLSSPQLKQIVLLAHTLPLAWSFIPIKPVSYQPDEALTSPHTTIGSNQTFRRVCEMCCVCVCELGREGERREWLIGKVEWPANKDLS